LLTFVSQRADDLAPNLGLWWYFFAEIFDHFRSFFLFVFNIQPLLLLLPISLRLARRPVVLTIIATFLITLFKVRSAYHLVANRMTKTDSPTAAWLTWRSAHLCFRSHWKRSAISFFAAPPLTQLPSWGG
jgi:hypothetical protein